VSGSGGTRAGALLWRALVVLSAASCLLLSVLPEPSRPVLSSAAVALAAAVLAAVTRWQLAGTLVLGATTLTVLLAAVLDASDLRPVQLTAATALLLALVTALDRSDAGAGPAAETVVRPPAGHRLGVPAVAVGAASLVAVAAAQDVVPSVGLVLAGLAAAVAALVVATRVHRG
jgi:hypothetical protein